ncbi:hypothetical protein BV20DRAFT_971337 [Pilatotrama ljubarskyi]|nr:hypothetical protein BV20DRAFT_971337 [Pilatotrama ljubarskyi]
MSTTRCDVPYMQKHLAMVMSQWYRRLQWRLLDISFGLRRVIIRRPRANIATASVHKSTRQLSGREFCCRGPGAIARRAVQNIAWDRAYVREQDRARSVWPTPLQTQTRYVPTCYASRCERRQCGCEACATSARDSQGEGAADEANVHDVVGKMMDQSTHN